VLAELIFQDHCDQKSAFFQDQFSPHVKISNRTLTSVKTRTELNPSSEGSFPSLGESLDLPHQGQHFFRTNVHMQDFSGPDFSFFIFQDLSGPVGTLVEAQHDYFTHK